MNCYLHDHINLLSTNTSIEFALTTVTRFWVELQEVTETQEHVTYSAILSAV